MSDYELREDRINENILELCWNKKSEIDQELFNACRHMGKDREENPADILECFKEEYPDTIKALEEYGIEQKHLSSIHADTNDEVRRVFLREVENEYYSCD